MLKRIAVIGAFGFLATVVVPVPAQAYNACGSQARVSYTYDQAYVRTFSSACTNMGVFHAYQPPTGGTYYTSIRGVANPSRGVGYPDAATAQLVWGKACSSTSTFLCNNAGNGFSSPFYNTSYATHN